jgi:hypothetical protein
MGQVMRIRRAFAAGVMAIVAALTLSSCENNLAMGPLAVKRSGSHMLIAVCTDLEVAQVLASYKTSIWSNKSPYFLKGTGSSSLHFGDILSTAGSWGDLTLTTQRDPVMDGGASLEIQMTAPKYVKQVSAAFKFTGDGLSRTRWLHPDGTLTKKPCDGVPDEPDK